MEERIAVARKISALFLTLDQEELKILASILKQKKVQKGELLLKEGEIAKDIFWVESGMLRQFYYKVDRDVTEHFACEGTGAICINSLFKSEGTKLMVEALENGIVYLIPYHSLVRLSENYTTFCTMLRKLLEHSLILSQQKADSWRYETARERYNRFLKEYPDAAKRASVNHIASYLLMTPESLSRVRAGTL